MTTEENKLKAFSQPKIGKVAGFVLRPFTAQSLIILQQVKNGFLSKITSEDPDIFFHIASFIFVHVEHLETVKDLIKDMEAFRSAVTDFSAQISVLDLVNSTQEIKKILDEAMLGQDYEIQPEANGTESPN